MAFDLRISEIHPGQNGTDLTVDWFEITNIGTASWVQGVDANLYYDDESANAADAVAITGLTDIQPGESVIVLISDAGQDSPASAQFDTVWGAVTDLTGVEIGHATDGAGLGGGGDAVTLFADAAGDGVTGEDSIHSAAYTDVGANDGASWEVLAERFSVDGVLGAVTTTAMGGNSNDTPNVGTPGYVTAAVISEFQPNPAGADPSTMDVELRGLPGQDFAGVLVSIESDSNAPGTVDRVAQVSGTFDANGLLTVSIPDLENPSFTLALLDSYSGDTNTDIDTNNDGVADDLSTFGVVHDAIGVPDDTADQTTVYGVDLGGVDFAFTGAEPELVFRDAKHGTL